MAVTNPLSDTLAAAASSIGGLLSQMEGALGNGLSSKDLFSNLLSQNANVDASLSATQTTTSKISTSSAFASNNQSSITSSPDSLMQTLENLAANLRKALAQLHQQNNDASNNTAQQNQTAQNKNTQDASTETPNSNVQTTVVAQNNTDASSLKTLLLRLERHPHKIILRILPPCQHPRLLRQQRILLLQKIRRR